MTFVCLSRPLCSTSEWRPLFNVKELICRFQNTQIENHKKLVKHKRVLVIISSFFFQNKWAVSSADKDLCQMKGKSAEV